MIYACGCLITPMTRMFVFPGPVNLHSVSTSLYMGRTTCSQQTLSRSQKLSSIHVIWESWQCLQRFGCTSHHADDTFHASIYGRTGAVLASSGRSLDSTVAHRKCSVWLPQGISSEMVQVLLRSWPSMSWASPPSCYSCCYNFIDIQLVHDVRWYMIDVYF